jgi:hypothetical protein
MTLTMCDPGIHCTFYPLHKGLSRSMPVNMWSHSQKQYSKPACVHSVTMSTHLTAACVRYSSELFCLLRSGWDTNHTWALCIHACMHACMDTVFRWGSACADFRSLFDATSRPRCCSWGTSHGRRTRRRLSHCDSSGIFQST